MDNRTQVIYQEGVKAYHEKNFEKAATIFTKLVGAEKESSAFNFFAGISLLAINKKTAAVRYLKKVITLKTNFHCTMKACIFLAYIYIEKEKYEDAFNTLRMPVENNYPNPFAYSMMGYLAHLNKKYEEADVYYKKCLEVAPDHPGFNNNYGYNLLVWKQDYKESAPYLEKAIRKNKKNSAYLHSLGWGLYMDERYEDSFKILSHAFKLKKANVIKEHLGLVEKKIKKKKK